MIFKMPHRVLVDIQSDLHLLQQQLEFVEEQLKMQEIPLQTKLETLGKDYDLGNDEDWGQYSAIKQEYDHEIEASLPRMIVNPFIVSAWSMYEASVSHLADLMREKRGAKLKLDDLRGGHFSDKAKKYFDHVLNFTFETPGYRKEDLTHLILVRNAIAHYNGRVVGIKDETTRKNIMDGRVNGVTVDGFREYLVINYAFAMRMKQAVERHLRDLMDQYEKEELSARREP